MGPGGSAGRAEDDRAWKGMRQGSVFQSAAGGPTVSESESSMVLVKMQVPRFHRIQIIISKDGVQESTI